MEQLLVRPAEAGDMLGISRSQTYELIRLGQLPSVRIGRVVRVPVEGLRDWVTSQTRNLVPPDLN